MSPSQARWALLASAAAICLPCPAAEPTTEQVQAQDAALHAVCFVDRDRGWAVGDHGLILGAQDGGRTWGRQATPVDCPLHGVWFVDRRHGWAVGGVTTPYTHSSRGVVLHTEDGGYTWSVQPSPLLPRLRGVRFFSRTHGVAWGESSHGSPSGVFETRDGGRHWEALHSDQPCDWAAAQLPAPGRGVLVDAQGRVGEIDGSVVRVEAGGLPSGGLRAVAQNSAGAVWVAGDDAQLWRSAAGDEWQELASAGPIHWRGVAALGRSAWLVGAPGSLIASTEDNGDSWRWRPTGVSTPLSAVTFVDQRHGWAVGAFGVILATTDGGETWRVQREGASHAAVVVVAPTAEDLPLEMIARLSAANGYRTAALVGLARRGAEQQQADRLAEVASGCGAVTCELAPTNTLTESELAAPAELLKEKLPGVDDRLATFFAHRLAVLRPQAVLFAPGDRRGAARLVEDALLVAARGEADPRLNQLGLAAWTPKRVLRIAQHERGSQAGFSTTDFQPRLGTSLMLHAQPLRGLLARHPSPPPVRLGWTALSGGVAPSAAHGDPLAGLVIEPGGPARRPHTSPGASGLAALKVQATKQGELQALLASNAGGSEWASRVLQLSGGLEPEAGAQQLTDLAWGYRLSGKSRLAADAFYLLARRYPDSRLTEHAIDWMLRYYASSETAHHARSAYQRSRQNGPLANVVELTPAQPGGWSPELTLAEHQDRALKLSEYVEQTRPVLFSDPDLRLALAAACRRQDQAVRAETLLAALGRSASPEDYQRCAATEANIDDLNRVGRPSVQAAAADQRPMLDGVLDEECWRSEPIDAGGAKVRLAMDGDHLYVSVEADRLAGAAYPASAAPRTRDADLGGYDRVELRLDLDRDYHTAFELTIDCRGWTHDACWGDPSWDPRWFVAGRSTADRWTVEAAIPLSELGASVNAAGGPWALAIERAAPQRTPRSWTGIAAADGSPDAFGLLLPPALAEAPAVE